MVVDNEVGAYKMTKYLIEKGHKRILNINGPKYLSTAILRYEGYKRAMFDYCLEVKDDMVFWGGNSIEKGYKIMNGLLNIIHEFDAIFASNDVTACGVIECLKDNGLKVPLDVSITGFDDINFMKYINPPLTTYKNYIYKMGEVAAGLLLDVFNSNNKKSLTKTVVEGEIVIRKSVREK